MSFDMWLVRWIKKVTCQQFFVKNMHILEFLFFSPKYENIATKKHRHYLTKCSKKILKKSACKNVAPTIQESICRLTLFDWKIVYENWNFSGKAYRHYLNQSMLFKISEDQKHLYWRKFLNFTLYETNFCSVILLTVFKKKKFRNTLKIWKTLKKISKTS